MENRDVAPQAAEAAGNAEQHSPIRRRSSQIGEFTRNQKRALAVMTVIALGFGAYFLRGYLELIALAGILAYFFRPLYVRLERRWNAGAASTLTVLTALAVVVLPLTGILAMAVAQIKQMIDSVSDWVAKTNINELGDRILQMVNDALDRIPFLDVELTSENIEAGASKLASSMGDFALNFAKESVGGIAGAVTAIIIFLYVFIAILGKGPKLVSLVKDLSPLSPAISDIYVSKIGAMAKATVGGQFLIALVQGLLGAVSIYIAGIHQGFFMFVIFLTVLSIIPLGSGIVTIPLGIAMALTGNIPGGILVALFHILVTSNVDNILRPMLVPRSAHLSPALMLLAVFAGLSMFGFTGIVFGPIIMIVIVTTIKLYRVVIKGAIWDGDLDDRSNDTSKKNPWKRFKDWLGAKRTSAKSSASGTNETG